MRFLRKLFSSYRYSWYLPYGTIFNSVAELKLFIFGSDFDHNFGSGSGSSSRHSHILALKTVQKHYR